MPVAVLLVQRGVFPCSPTKPRTGVSTDLLEIYHALFECSCDAITALASALHTIYDRRGFKVLSTRNPGLCAQDPFREGLANAVAWSSNLRDRLQAKLHAALSAAEDVLFPPAITPAEPTLEAAEASEAVEASEEAAEAEETMPASTPLASEAHETDTPPPPPSTPDNDTPPSETGPSLTPGRASRLLRKRCPACLGLEEWGRDLEADRDVILGADGCFSYRHLRSAGDAPNSHNPAYFLPAEKVQKVRERILNARKKPSPRHRPKIPNEAIDACEHSWDAANEKKQKADPKRYDASGIFVITCRHSQVLFLANIDTPGEQQCYIVVLMEEVISQCPPQATFVEAYDVGCVTDRSLNLYPILTKGYRERV
ncbi:hypothetical protein K438DRAFT_1976761 [Mycena galopus ATCC 62051]|nr:hypothetical protein K438DRAFT_1976761 [Mycena galopus ATCC 62051]